MKASKMEDEFGARNSCENILSILKLSDHSARRNQKKHPETFWLKRERHCDVKENLIKVYLNKCCLNYTLYVNNFSMTVTQEPLKILCIKS